MSILSDKAARGFAQKHAIKRCRGSSRERGGDATRFWNDVRTRAWHLREWHGTFGALVRPISASRFLLLNRETTNYTYPVGNPDELARFLGPRLATSAETVRARIDELLGDEQLRSTLEKRLASRRDRNHRVHFGRRVGWYAIARIIKPRLVFETGTHDGLGTVVFARALEQNAAEGVAGRVLTFDQDPAAGWLVPESLRSRVEFRQGNLEQTLPAAVRHAARGGLELFVHDSLHTYEHETFELQTVWPILSRQAVLLSDHAHASKALADFSQQKGLDYGFWKEQPKGHPYPGAGIGMATPRPPTPSAAP